MHTCSTCPPHHLLFSLLEDFSSLTKKFEETNPKKQQELEWLPVEGNSISGDQCSPCHSPWQLTVKGTLLHHTKSLCMIAIFFLIFKFFYRPWNILFKKGFYSWMPSDFSFKSWSLAPFVQNAITKQHIFFWIRHKIRVAFKFEKKRRWKN